MSIRGINPIVNGMTGDEANFYPAANLIVCVAAGERFRRQTQSDKVVEQSAAYTGGERVEGSHRL